MISSKAILTGLLVLLWLASPAPLHAQSPSREYSLRAAFLLNFAQMTSWPTNVFAGTNSPVIVGILGDDPYGETLDETLRGETCNGRPFLLRRNLKLNDATDCHILVIGRSELKRLPDIATRLKNLPVLTVGNFDPSESRNVMIRLFTENNRIRFQVNLDLLKASNLNVSSKLLRVAEVSPPQTK